MKRHALITGGTRGIGAGIARHLQSLGYTVSANYFSNDAAAKSMESEGIYCYKWDVGDFAACEQYVEHITSHHGPIDTLINNAGITCDGFLHKMTPEMWGKVIHTNLSACFNMCRIVIPDMRARTFGRIVNISSVNGVKGQAGQTNYAAAKAGILGLTKSLALESASKGITVNAIAPGYVDTDMVKAISTPVMDAILQTVPARRLGTTDEVARAVAYLVDEKSEFVNGATLHINGGQYLT